MVRIALTFRTAAFSAAPRNARRMFKSRDIHVDRINRGLAPEEELDPTMATKKTAKKSKKGKR